MAMMSAKRSIAVTTPLGGDELLFRRMSATEELGRLFRYDLELIGPSEAVKLEDVLGKDMAVRIDAHDGTRFLHGNVSRFSYAGRTEGYAIYHATLRPWLWFLTRTADCKIFQEMKVPDIIKEVFRELGFTDFEDRLSGTYRTWNYCVQYRETDFNFVSRLMEAEGIYYYFKHEEGRHTLVLSDGISSHEPAPGYAEIPYIPPDMGAVHDRDHVSDWSLWQEVQPGAYEIDDYDFKKPKADLTAKSQQARPHSGADYDVYDYPGEYLESGDGDSYVKVRLEELQAMQERVSGAGDARGVAVGALFTLTKFPREDQNREYLVVSTSYELEAAEYESGASSEAPAVSCSFVAMPSKNQFRSTRSTPKPMIRGPQTAVVVGKAGEEIWTDEFGRVKLQFHWDRYGKADENSSCWVRVSQLWAGTNWGGIHIPRIGQEVVVEFLEGDPDRPLVTGRVYNQDNMPPYGLPGNKTQSGIKSRSSKGGGPDNFNELRFEDKKGSELVYLHAEKDQSIHVENDETHYVGHDRKKTVDHDETTEVKNDRTETVGHNETITVKNDRTERVDKNEKISIGENRTEDVGKDETITIKGNRTETVSKEESVTIQGGRTQNVSKDESVTIGGARTESVSKDETITIQGGRTEKVTKDESITISGKRTVQISKDDTQDIGKKFVLQAGDEIVLKTGQSMIHMKKDGKIVIKGKDITVQGSGKINVKASGDITLKGSKIKEN